jgi:hypothetical protein
MKTMLFIALGAGLAVIGGDNLRACGMPTKTLRESLANRAISSDESRSALAVAQLRAQGPEGLRILLKTYDAQIAQSEQGSDGKDPGERAAPAWKMAMDKVAGQCDAWASRLFWYTDLEQAKAAARESHKPILSLRLLGRLDEEYSCANSRFFRTTLYPNAEVSKYLRDHFVLHWESVRPVPRITIDFGDGRRLERTITGNSVHYVLDWTGTPIDALPGLYGPQAFLKGLANAERAAIDCAELDGAAKKAYLITYHRRARVEIANELKKDLDSINTFANAGLVTKEKTTAAPLPTAQAAGRLAFSKSAIESPLLRSLQPKRSKSGSGDGAALDEEAWARLAQWHSSESRLDEVARGVVMSKSAGQASKLTVSKGLVEDPFLGTWRNLQRSIAEDTVRNEFLLHAQIHNWFVQGTAPSELRELNAKVYAELFLMPESDPWLGLAPIGIFTGLPNEGLVQATP